jgi:hypothetical protein
MSQVLDSRVRQPRRATPAIHLYDDEEAEIGAVPAWLSERAAAGESPETLHGLRRRGDPLQERIEAIGE